MEKGRETNENIPMEEKHPGMRKIGVIQEQRFKRLNNAVKEEKELKPKLVATLPCRVGPALKWEEKVT